MCFYRRRDEKIRRSIRWMEYMQRKNGADIGIFFDDDEYDDTDDDDLIPYIVIKVAHLYGFQGSWNVIPRMLAKIIDGIPI